ncbi:MAG: YqgE/AlgH family protein, partial [Candidatus Binatia bacterium]
PALIIAMPQLMDPNFHRTVVLLIEKTEQGAFGVVINRTGESKVAELCSGLNVDWGGEGTEFALYGGPVGTHQGFLLHGPTPDDVVVNSREVAPGVRIASDMETFRTLCERPPLDFRVLLGYAGWAPGQLENEMRNGAWLTTEVASDLVFRTALDEVWEKSLRGLGVDPAMLVLGGGVH